MLQPYQEIPPVLTPRFEFGDFLLLRLIPVRVRFIGGFARAYMRITRFAAGRSTGT